MSLRLDQQSHGKLDWLQKGHKSAAFIDLPLSDDGSTVNHLLTAFIETQCSVLSAFSS